MRMTSVLATTVGVVLDGDPPPIFGDESKTTPSREKPDLYSNPLPAGAVPRLGTIRLRHPEGVMSVALSPNGQLLAPVTSAVFPQSQPFSWTPHERTDKRFAR